MSLEVKLHPLQRDRLRRQALLLSLINQSKDKGALVEMLITYMGNTHGSNKRTVQDYLKCLKFRGEIVEENGRLYAWGSLPAIPLKNEPAKKQTVLAHMHDD